MKDTENKPTGDLTAIRAALDTMESALMRLRAIDGTWQDGTADTQLAAARAELAALEAKLAAQGKALELADIITRDGSTAWHASSNPGTTYEAMMAYRAARAKVQP